MPRKIIEIVLSDWLKQLYPNMALRHRPWNPKGTITAKCGVDKKTCYDGSGYEDFSVRDLNSDLSEVRAVITAYSANCQSCPRNRRQDKQGS